MYQKARVSPNSLHLIIHSDRAQMKRIHKMAGHAVRQYYGINDAEYPLPEGVDGEEFSLRIMLALWDRFNEEHQ